MYRIAVVEDEAQSRQLLTEYIERYEAENPDVKFELRVFHDGMEFIENYKPDYDVVFMDIEMPLLDGMRAARKMRETDEDVCLIFVTNLIQYAVNGYEVGAMDFIVKPVGYFNFKMKLSRAIRYRLKNKRETILLPAENGKKKVAAEEVYYIDVYDHTLTYHTAEGEYSERGSISEKEKELAGLGFARCSNSFLVNLQHVSEFTPNAVVVQRQTLQISRSKKKDFMRALTDYTGTYGKR